MINGEMIDRHTRILSVIEKVFSPKSGHFILPT